MTPVILEAIRGWEWECPHCGEYSQEPIWRKEGDEVICDYKYCNEKSFVAAVGDECN